MFIYFKPHFTINFKGPISAKKGEDIFKKYKMVIKNIETKEARNFFIELKLIAINGAYSLGHEYSYGSEFISSLLPGGATDPSGFTILIPPNLPPGEYRFCVFVDPTKIVDESDENNNQACQSIKITKNNKRRIKC